MPTQRRKKLTVLLLIFAAVCLEVAGQILYKAGLNREPVVQGSLRYPANLLLFARQAITNWRVLLGLGVYVAEVLLYWVVLSRVDVSYAFPMMSMSYVILMASSRLFLHEKVSPIRWLGGATVMLGVYLITRSAPLPK
jgi:drug/metabolite transporter (DMT)-like permease